MAYALSTTAENVEERCRQIRNVAPDSAHHARRAWGSRSLTMWRDEALRFMTADRRTIPRCGYRLGDFVDDDVGESNDVPSAEGFRAATMQRTLDEVREPAMIYRIG